MSPNTLQNSILIAVLAAATTAFVFAAVYNPLRKVKKEARCAKKGKLTGDGPPDGATQIRKALGPSKAAIEGDDFGGRLLEKWALREIDTLYDAFTVGIDASCEYIMPKLVVEACHQILFGQR